MVERKTPVEVTFSKEKNVPVSQLDELFSAIGWRPRGETKWKKVLEKSSLVLTAWDGERIVGMGRIWEDGVMCMFYDIGVHPDYQRQTIGTQIMEKLVDEVKDKEFASIGLFAWEENPANIPLYEKFGFVKREGGMELLKHMKPE